MKTLVIHPEDPTTDFLSRIYLGIECDVADDPFIPNYQLKSLIPQYDRIIALGHGCPDGLFGGLDLILNSDHTPLLKDKRLVCIWCNADQFMLEQNLRGFYSGMFISEVHEAGTYGIYTSQELVSRSNNLFASILGEYIDHPDVLRKVKYEYYTPNDPVVAFNNARLFND